MSMCLVPLLGLSGYGLENAQGVFKLQPTHRSRSVQTDVIVLLGSQKNIVFKAEGSVAPLVQGAGFVLGWLIS